MNLPHQIDIKKMYDDVIITKKKYENITTIENAKKFIESEKQLYIELDKIKLNENYWVIDDEKNNVCTKCNYKFYLFYYFNHDYRDNIQIINKKKIHQLFECKSKNI